jgi:hypothetical protein
MATVSSLAYPVIPVMSVLIFNEKTGEKQYIETSLVMHKKGVLMLLGKERGLYPPVSRWIEALKQAGEIRVNPKAKQGSYKILVWLSEDLEQSQATEVEKVRASLFLENESVEDPRWQKVIRLIGSTCRQIFPKMQEECSYFHATFRDGQYDYKQVLFPNDL